MNKLLTTNTGGLPLVLDDIRWFLGQSDSDSGIYQALNSLLRSFGDDFIVYGCDVVVNAIAEGWIMLGGELLKVDAHNKTDAYYEKVTTYDAVGYKTFENATDVNTYEKNRGVCSAAAGDLGYGGDTLADKIKILVASWQDRGDPSTYDYNSWTINGIWQEVDLSAIIPSGFNLVWCRLHCIILNTLPSDIEIMFRKNGNTNESNVFKYTFLSGTLAGNIYIDFMCFMDTNRIIEYNFPGIVSTYVGPRLYVKGWM